MFSDGLLKDNGIAGINFFDEVDDIQLVHAVVFFDGSKQESNR